MLENVIKTEKSVKNDGQQKKAELTVYDYKNSFATPEEEEAYHAGMKGKIRVVPPDEYKNLPLAVQKPLP